MHRSIAFQPPPAESADGGESQREPDREHAADDQRPLRALEVPDRTG
ncbi:hypothetical protein ACFWWM_42490 [Streptomyces sp. NPDC058682]